MANAGYDKTGNLTKLGAQFKNWNSRWFALSNAKKTMLYFKTEEDMKQHIASGARNQQGQINLHNAFAYRCDYLSDRPHSFELSTPGRNYFIQGKSKEELEDWLAALAACGVRMKAPEKVQLLTYQGPSQAVSTVISKHGYLQKRGNFINYGFKKRFCRITENAAGHKVLAYYKSHDEVEPQGYVNLHEAKIVDPMVPTEKNPKPAGDDADQFHIATKERTFIFRAETVKDKQQWMEVLNACIRGEDNPESFKPSKIPVSDLYAVLKINSSATPEDIKAAYNERVKVVHPDKNNNAPEAVEEFTKLSEAYEILRDPEKRAKYDAQVLENGTSEKKTPQTSVQSPQEDKFVSSTGSPSKTEPSKSTAPVTPRADGTSVASSPANSPPGSPNTTADSAEKPKFKQRPKKGTGKLPEENKGEDSLKPPEGSAPAATGGAASTGATAGATAAGIAVVPPSTPTNKDKDSKSVAATTPTADTKSDTSSTSSKKSTAASPASSPPATPKAGDKDSKDKDKKDTDTASAKKKGKEKEVKASPNATPSPIDSKLPKEIQAAMEQCDKGISMFKLPRSGAPKQTAFYIKPVAPEGTYALKWDSGTKKSDEATIVLVKGKVKLVEGHGAPESLFGKARFQIFSDKEDVSFSVVASKRTMDCVANNKEDYKHMIAALKHFLN